MSNILPTIGPVTESFENISSLLKFTKILRLNGAHNTLLWHERISKKIKKINPNSQILLDIPGVKARCKNKNELLIKKGDVVLFYFQRKPKISITRCKNHIPLSGPLPQVKNNVKYFSVSDGKFNFRLTNKGKNFIVGTSADTFNLKSNKGINIPLSIYNEKYQTH